MSGGLVCLSALGVTAGMDSVNPAGHRVFKQNKRNKDGPFHRLIRRALGLPGGVSSW